MMLKLAAAFALACSLVHAPTPALAAPTQDEAPAIEVSAPSRAAVRAALAKRRTATIAAFLAYREARVYPKNTFRRGTQHVWVDASGRLCAAATIISKDWGLEATVAVAAEDRFVALATATGELADWILTSGLTRQEIVAIQAPAPRVEREDHADRLHEMYVDVERQIRSLYEQNLDLATDALMKRPDLAFALVDHGTVAGPGHFAKRTVAAR